MFRNNEHTKQQLHEINIFRATTITTTATMHERLTSEAPRTHQQDSMEQWHRLSKHKKNNEKQQTITQRRMKEYRREDNQNDRIKRRMHEIRNESNEYIQNLMSGSATRNSNLSMDQCLPCVLSLFDDDSMR
jgi:hypothetical protein